MRGRGIKLTKEGLRKKEKTLEKSEGGGLTN